MLEWRISWVITCYNFAMNELDIGAKIAKLRKERGFTQKDLADFLNVTDKAVSRWESGAGNPDIALLPKIAKLLGTSTDYLLGVSEKPPKNNLDSNQADNPDTSPLFRGDESQDDDRFHQLKAAKGFAIAGSFLRCALFFALSLIFRDNSIGMVSYVLGIALAVIGAIFCFASFPKINKAKKKKDVIAIGIFDLFLCSLVSGILLLTTPRAEFLHKNDVTSSFNQSKKRSRQIASLVLILLGFVFLVLSIGFYGLTFYSARSYGMYVSGLQVMFDYQKVFQWAKGSSGWLVFTYFGEYLLALGGLTCAAYWFIKIIRPSSRDLSNKGIIFIGTSLMIAGWIFGTLIANSDIYTGYRADSAIQMEAGATLATIFCIVGSNLCGIGVMVPLQKETQKAVE